MNQYAPKVFTRANPCTKVEIHNCFYKEGGGYQPRSVIEARTEIGLNVPKYLTREGYATLELRRGVDYLILTPEGEQWLTDGLTRQLELHPERRLDCKGLAVARPRVPAKRLIRSR